MSYEKHGRGVVASLLVHADLIKRGYQVFTEDTSQGLVDLVAVHLETGETRYVDVKCLARRADGSKINRVLKAAQKEFEKASQLTIELVYADVDTYEIQYPLRRNA
jgi:predicted RNA-binding protein with TRAM domain